MLLFSAHTAHIEFSLSLIINQLLETRMYFGFFVMFEEIHAAATHSIESLMCNGF